MPPPTDHLAAFTCGLWLLAAAVRLAGAGLGRTRAGTVGGRRALAAGLLFAPLAAALAVPAAGWLWTWVSWRFTLGAPPAWAGRVVGAAEAATFAAACAFAAGQIPLASAAHAVLLAADRYELDRPGERP